MQAYNLPVGPSRLSGLQGCYAGGWSVVERADNRNVRDLTALGNDLSSFVKRFSADTRWRYDTGSGYTAGGGAGVGGGKASGQLVMKHADTGERVRLEYDVAGGGLTMPGLGGSAAGEGWPSVAMSHVRSGPAGGMPFAKEQFTGDS